MKLRERAEWWGVDPEPLIAAVESAMRGRQYWQGQQPLIASAEPAQANKRLRQAHKAVASLPLRARAALHWAMAERVTSIIPGLDPEQIRHVMQDISWPDLILDALGEPVEPEADRECQWLVEAWKRAGGQVKIDYHYDGDLIEFLGIAYKHLGEEPSDDAIRRRLDRIRRDPLDSEG